MQNLLTQEQELLRAKIEKELDVTGIKANADVFEKLAKRRIAKIAGLGLSNSQAEEKDFNDLVKDAEASVSQRIEEAQKHNDSTLTEELNRYKTKQAELIQQIDTITKDRAEEIERINGEYTQRIDDFEINNVFTKLKSETKFINDSFADLFSTDIMTKIKSDYKVGKDGTLLAKDGTKAISPAGNEIWTSVSDAWKHYSEPYVAKSNTGINGGGLHPSPQPAPQTGDKRVDSMVAYLQNQK